MSRTLQDDLDKDIKPWPQDWDLHIIKTCNFVFDEDENQTGVECLQISSDFKAIASGEPVSDPSYEFLRECIDLESIDLRAILLFKERYYVCHFNKDAQTVVGNLFRVIDCNFDTGVLVVKPLYYLRGASGYECVQKMVKAIQDDWHDGNDDDDVSDPTPDPTESLDLSPAGAD